MCVSIFEHDAHIGRQYFSGVAVGMPWGSSLDDSVQTEALMAKITVLSPAGGQRAATTAVPALPGDLRGLTVGFLDNTKHNFDRLVDGIGAVLVERFGAKRTVHLKKANAAPAASHEIVAAMAKECDLVFAGSAD